MGYDLCPKNKNVEEMRINAFVWPFILQDTGMGYILGYGAGLRPGTYVYLNGNNGSPASNDGYKVTASEAKIMAQIARGYLSVKSFVNKEWDDLKEDERKQMEEWNKKDKIYTSYTGARMMDIIKQFADFAEKSGGFRID